MPRRKVGNIRNRILEAVGAGATWSEIQRKTKLSKAALSKHLNDLVASGLVKREVDVAKKPPAVRYKKTQSQKWSELVTFPQISLKLDVREQIFKGKVKSLYDVTPEGKAFCDVAIYLDEEKREILDAISSFLKKDKEYPEISLRQIASWFIDLLKQAMFNVYGFQSWQGWDKEPIQLQKLVEQERKALDFEATLVLHFNGKEIVQKIDWDGLINKYVELDESAHVCWKIFVDTIANDVLARYNWLVDETIEKAREVESVSAQKFLATAFPHKLQEIAENMWVVFGTPEKAKEALLAEVYTSAFGIVVEGLTRKPLIEVYDTELIEQPQLWQKLEVVEAQAEKVIDEMVKEGVIEFVPIYLPRLSQKANEKQWQAKEGYPSPTAYLREEPEPEIEVEEEGNTK